MHSGLSLQMHEGCVALSQQTKHGFGFRRTRKPNPVPGATTDPRQGGPRGPVGYQQPDVIGEAFHGGKKNLRGSQEGFKIRHQDARHGVQLCVVCHLEPGIPVDASKRQELVCKMDYPEITTTTTVLLWTLC